MKKIYQLPRNSLYIYSYDVHHETPKRYYRSESRSDFLVKDDTFYEDVDVVLGLLKKRCEYNKNKKIEILKQYLKDLTLMIDEDSTNPKIENIANSIANESRYIQRINDNYKEYERSLLKK